MGETGYRLDELYQAQLELMSPVRRGLTDVRQLREALTQEVAQLGAEARQIAAECDQATEAGDARGARELLERQREVLDRIEAANVELRTVQGFETVLIRQTRALQQAVDGLRTAKESAKAEIALTRAERMNDE